MHPGSPFKSSADEASFIPCCVPYWDMQDFFKNGGLYSEERGYHVLIGSYLEPMDEWLPRKWQYRGDPPVPVILPDMLPSNTWEANLRHQLSDVEWDRLRKFCYKAAGYRCIACGISGEPHLEAHEAWRFDMDRGIQRLSGLLCLCPTCHKIKHLGFANRIGRLPQVLSRLRWLNDWDDQRLTQELDSLKVRQEALSAKSWELDLSFLRSYGVR